MAWLKVYQWEHERFKWEQRILIRPEYRRLLTERLAKHWGIKVRVDFTKRNGGECVNGWIIKLPTSNNRCPLGVILHEIAHAYDSQKYGNRGHEKTFRNCLSLIYHQSRPMLRVLLLAVKAEAKMLAMEQKAAAEKQATKIESGAIRQASREALRKSPAFKMERLRIRIKRLESRAKRIGTLLKSAKRSLSAMERIQRMKVEQAGHDGIDYKYKIESVMGSS